MGFEWAIPARRAFLSGFGKVPSDVVCFFNETPGEVIFESKINHPPVPDVAVELKGLEI